MEPIDIAEVQGQIERQINLYDSFALEVTQDAEQEEIDEIRGHLKITNSYRRFEIVQHFDLKWYRDGMGHVSVEFLVGEEHWCEVEHLALSMYFDLAERLRIADEEKQGRNSAPESAPGDDDWPTTQAIGGADDE